jgi:hypothetical protein
VFSEEPGVQSEWDEMWVMNKWRFICFRAMKNRFRLIHNEFVASV